MPARRMTVVIAARIGRCAAAVLLLLLSAAAAADAGSRAPLADAVERMDRPGIDALLKQRVDVNATQVDGMTALHWAAYQDDVAIAKRLIDAGAKANAANRYGVTPLSLACTNGDGPLVELLLQGGADPDLALPGGETPLMTAARSGALGAVKALLARHVSVDGKDERRGQTALMWAAAEGHADVTQALIEAGADFQMRLPSGFTPLLFAARNGRGDVVRVLLKAGANVNDAVPSGRRSGYGGRLPRSARRPCCWRSRMGISNWPPNCSTPAPIPMPRSPATPSSTPSSRSATRASATTIPLPTDRAA